MFSIKVNVPHPEQYSLPDNGIFPNSLYPVMHYRAVLDIPLLFATAAVKALFRRNNWGNNWRSGILTMHHYHSTSHEALAVISGQTRLLLGGDKGVAITIAEGDVLILPAGVAHKNLGGESDAICIGGYPDGMQYDVNYGKSGERPLADRNIAQVKIPATDPVLGTGRGVAKIWDMV